jgi:hypothetical protein
MIKPGFTAEQGHAPDPASLRLSDLVIPPVRSPRWMENCMNPNMKKRSSEILDILCNYFRRMERAPVGSRATQLKARLPMIKSLVGTK